MRSPRIINRFFGRKKTVAADFPPPYRAADAELASATTTPQNEDYYSGATNESAARTFDESTRITAQSRGEMEALDDSLFFGALQKVAALVVGPGPALKIDGPFAGYKTPPLVDQSDKMEYLEFCFSRFATSVGLLDKTRLIAMELLFHGESFLRKVPSPKTLEGFDYVFIRPGRVYTPPAVGYDPLVLDGVIYDRPDDAALPIAYYVQRENVNPFLETLEFDVIPEREIIHVFNAVLPGQRRGIPEAQSAFGLIRELKLLRHYEIQASKNAAKFSVILRMSDPTLLNETIRQGGRIDLPKTGKTYSLEDGIMPTFPGYEPIFGDSKHPATGFDALKKTLGADVGSALGLGGGKVNNDHSAYNFSSAKMDEQTDAHLALIRQKKIAAEFLDVVFNDWLYEFAERDPIGAETLDAAGSPENVARRWLFPQPRSIDRLKDAQTDEINLRLGTTTIEEIAARDGKDADVLLRTWGAEQKRRAEILKENGLALSTSGELSTEPTTPTNGGTNGEGEGI